MRRDGNVVGGEAQLNGPVIQAGEVTGGIHLHGAARQPPLPVPRQLPPLTAHFMGRDDDLAALDDLRSRHDGHSAPLIVVSGPAGVGKTALVTRWLRDTNEAYPDGHLYADLRGHSPEGPAEPGEILGQFLRALGVGPVPAGLAEQAALWRSVTANLRIGIVIDNVLSAAQVRPILPGGRGGLTVVTSRNRLTGLGVDGALVYHLGVLDPAAAEELLSRGVGRERVQNEAAAAREVVLLCAGLPLAVCLAAARLAARPKQPLRALVEALAEDRDRLEELTVEGEKAVRSGLDGSYAVLSEGAARLYRRWGLLPVRVFEVRSAAAVCGVPMRVAERLIDALLEANLIEESGPDAYRFHDLVRLHARERGFLDETDGSRSETLRRACDWYLATATEAQRLLTPIQLTLRRDFAFCPDGLPLPFDDEIGALEWLAAHRLDLLEAVRTATGQGWYDTGWQIVDAMWPLFLRLRHYGLWIEAHELGLAAAERAGDQAAERQMLNSGAIGFTSAHRIDDAIDWYHRSLIAAREAGDVRDEGQALHGLGTCHREAGRTGQAVSYLAQAITAWESCGYQRGAALSRIIVGEIALEDDDIDRAVGCFSQAHTLLTEVRDPYDAARALAFLGYAHTLAATPRKRAADAGADAYERGIGELREALAVFEASGATHWRARALELLGRSAQHHGDTDAAREFYERSRAAHLPHSPDEAERLAGRLVELGG
ncbi:tetratricopeptide repeat protein [Streptomyces noursei]|uniref:tetratricopeptide repeat protein n=1 Tax=Streptomyces noursei TaxID=1971 RepID=UPI00081CCEA8|nr:putative regulator protein [Streptomyces noursei ATCC 11455]MCZ0996142.1 tetratricopeptide repeat protein [Streptomyces noursei]